MRDAPVDDKVPESGVDGRLQCAPCLPFELTSLFVRAGPSLPNGPRKEGHLTACITAKENTQHPVGNSNYHWYKRTEEVFSRLLR